MSPKVLAGLWVGANDLVPHAVEVAVRPVEDTGALESLHGRDIGLADIALGGARIGRLRSATAEAVARVQLLTLFGQGGLLLHLVIEVVRFLVLRF